MEETKKKRKKQKEKWRVRSGGMKVAVPLFSAETKRTEQRWRGAAQRGIAEGQRYTALLSWL